MKIKLIAYTKPVLSKGINSLNGLVSFSALTCYSSKEPKLDLIDIKKKLFQTGHHTTFEHIYFTFFIEDISVGDVTFGLHLVSPFYNSSQRSGRYASKMFKEKDIISKKIVPYIGKFWPEIDIKIKEKITDYIQEQINLFNSYLPKIIEIAYKDIGTERPYISLYDLKKNAPKIAQEQLRMFLPVIFPTGLVISLDLISLLSLKRAAWTKPLKFFTSMMAKIVSEKFPELNSILKLKTTGKIWAPDLDQERPSLVIKKPHIKLLGTNKYASFTSPSQEMISPLDLLPFSPKTMNLNLSSITMEVEVSLATFGQDQRHRTILRGKPRFTGSFYLPPLLKEAGLKKQGLKTIESWLSFKNIVPPDLWTILAPYGAMVRYKKTASSNAIIHEQSKRLCWLAQEEIYHLSCLLRREVKKDRRLKALLPFFEPPCYKGDCPEGTRYCGRNILDKETYFQTRTV